jgi:Tol biopolymer transport system component
MRTILFFVVIGITLINAQISVISMQELPVPHIQQWNQPVFSPTGKEIYLTNVEYNGIWQYSLETHLLKEITTDSHSGYDFSLSEDGTKLAYRTTVQPGDHITRKQQSVELSLKTGEKKILLNGNSVGLPRFSQNDVIQPETYRSGVMHSSQPQRPPQVLGVEDGKIVVIQQSSKRSVDPLANGRYIWPSLSTDAKKIAAVEMDRGAFVCDLDGSNVIRIGKCNAPRWTRSGHWIIGMEDTDDGHQITGSEIVAVSEDGTQRIMLTATPAQHEMYPAVSKTEDRIVAVTSDGRVLLMTFAEGE